METEKRSIRQLATKIGTMRNGIFIWVLLFLSCSSPKLMKDKEAIVIIAFENGWAGDDEYPYFGKSWHLKVNNLELDANSWFPDDMAVFKEIQKVIEKKYGSESFLKNDDFCNTTFYSKKNGGLHYSDHIFEKIGEEKKLYIIYKLKGDVLKIKKIREDDLIRENHRYSCPIEEDLLNIPFYHVVGIDSFYPIDDKFLKKNNFIKSNIDSFMVNFCD